MTYVEPKANVLDAHVDGAVATVVARLDRVPSRPVAPAALYLEPNSGAEQFQLHRLVRVAGQTLTFETLNPLRSLPEIGRSYFFRSWWTKRALEAVLDRSATWTRESYPRDGSHEHCLFTWTAIGATDEHTEGYRSKYGWITVKAYEEFIRDDIYRIRESCDA